MTTVLYADVLFFINFSMDFISVYIAAQLLSLRRSALRFSLASLIGALGATAMTALSVAALPQTVLTLVLSVVMTAAAYGGARSLGQFLFRTLTLWGGGALLGGCVTAVCSIGERGGDTVRYTESACASRPAALAVSGIFLCVFVVRALKPKLSRKTAFVRITLGGRRAGVGALVDSGNLAADPVSGSPVIFVSHESLEDIVPKTELDSMLSGDITSLPEDMKRRIRLIPIGEEGASRIVTAFRPDLVSVSDGGGRRTHNADAVICVSDKGCGFYGGEAALIPLSLLR